jgi:rhodanese-related sulfurtransferase
MIIDVRTKEEWEDGHMAGAINVPLRDIEEGRIPFDLEDIVRLYCVSGIRANLALHALEKAGYQNVELYNEGKMGI